MWHSNKINKIEITKCFKYKDEDDFIKKMRSLKTYCPRAYKELIFHTSKKDLYNSKNGMNVKQLFTDELFKRVYGQIELVYQVENGCVIIEDLTPQEFLLDGYFNYLEAYKGTYFRNDKDKFKIDIAIKMLRKEV